MLVVRVKAYLRYVDDLILLSDSKQQLHDWQHKIDEYLVVLRLRIHPKKANIFTVYEGVDVLGYRVFPGFRQLRNDNGFRFARKLRHFALGWGSGHLSWDDFNPSVQSWLGHACHADTFGLRRRIFADTVFTREKSN